MTAKVLTDEELQEAIDDPLTEAEDRHALRILQMARKIQKDTRARATPSSTGRAKREAIGG